jgi:hypothetical protein
MKKITLIIASVLILAIGVAAFLYFTRDPFHSDLKKYVEMLRESQGEEIANNFYTKIINDEEDFGKKFASAELQIVKYMGQYSTANPTLSKVYVMDESNKARLLMYLSLKDKYSKGGEAVALNYAMWEGNFNYKTDKKEDQIAALKKIANPSDKAIEDTKKWLDGCYETKTIQKLTKFQLLSYDMLMGLDGKAINSVARVIEIIQGKDGDSAEVSVWVIRDIKIVEGKVVAWTTVSSGNGNLTDEQIKEEAEKIMKGEK